MPLAPTERSARRGSIAVGLIALLVLVEIAAVVVGAWLFAEVRNTLLRNGRWASTKERLEMEVMAARAYKTSRQALADGHLDLGGWHGFQEVLWKDPVAPRRIACDFLLTKSSYFVFVFGHTGDEFGGLRVSAHSHFKSHFLTGTGTGEFTSFQRVHLPELEKSDWIHLEAEFTDERVLVRLNGQALEPFRYAVPESSRFGFRGGRNAVLVDNVELELADGHVVRESFTNVRDLRSALALGFGAILVLNALLWLVVKGTPRLARHWKKLGVSFAVGTAVLLVGGYVVYEKRFARSYAVPEAAKEDRWRATHTEEVVREVAREHDAAVVDDVTRVLVIGTSQTWGSGARTKDETFVATLERLLNADPSDARTWECINGGISSSRSYLLLEVFEQRWIHFDPDAVVINLSNNDRNPQRFEEALGRFVQLNQERGIPTLFVLEATSVERRLKGLALHAVMRAVAERHGIGVIDMHEWMKVHSRRGFQWWDEVHPTSFGHALIAERLVGDVRALVPRD